MATYVFSDVHGHRATLDRLLERVSPGADDVIYMLGDMIDRGPDPVGVMQVCRDLPNCTVLLGNHEDLMLSFLLNPKDSLAEYNWTINGGYTTAEGLVSLSMGERNELLDWVRGLPLWRIVRVGERPFVLVHAGIFPKEDMPCGPCTDEELEAMLAQQNTEDLAWIRDDFWGRPTGLLNAAGEGAIVVAGHTPTVYLPDMADKPDRDPFNSRGLCQMVRVGACEATGNVADRWDIDCGAAGGASFGQLLMLRLDDEEEFYEPVRAGE